MRLLVRYAERHEMWRTRNAASGLDIPGFLFFLLVSSAFVGGLFWRWAAFSFCLLFAVLFFAIAIGTIISGIWRVRKAWEKDSAERDEELVRKVMDS